MLIIKAGSDSERLMDDNSRTMEYVCKLSFAAMVTVQFPEGHWQEWECGKVIASGKHNIVTTSKLERIHKHIRAAKNQSTFHGAIYSQFKPYIADNEDNFQAYSEALQIVSLLIVSADPSKRHEYF